LSQLALDWSRRSDFDGETFRQDRDGARLFRQLEAVKGLMADGRWRSYTEIGEELGIPQASASARVRDLRKVKFGALTVERRYDGEGLWRFRVANCGATAAQQQESA
jgi:hypothetical protein